MVHKNKLEQTNQSQQINTGASVNFLAVELWSPAEQKCKDDLKRAQQQTFQSMHMLLMFLFFKLYIFYSLAYTHIYTYFGLQTVYGEFK